MCKECVLFHVFLSTTFVHQAPLGPTGCWHYLKVSGYLPYPSASTAIYPTVPMLENAPKTDSLDDSYGFLLLLCKS